MISIIMGQQALAANTTLCLADEHDYFSCHIAQSNKVISICGSLPDTADKDLQYRFGLPNNVEFVYPQSLKNGGDKFYFAEYVRSKVTKQSLHFKNKSYVYVVEVNSDAEEQPSQFEAIVSVEGPKSVTLSCKPKSFKGIDSAISNITKCDPDSALNIGKCVKK
ncbi:MAG TPA: hypothetical protein VM571_01150 [Noviherbaspirillum sp.]|nr:hypothetical protein [Noviherbaspirillum sp.]